MVLAFAALLHPRAAAAGPTDTFGFFSRSTAMGSATTADATDVSANFYNPAGLTGAKGLEFDVGYVGAWHFLRTNGRDNEVDAVHGMVFGLVAPGTVAGIPIAFGVALHLPDERVFRVRSLEQEQPRWEMYDNRTQEIFFAANLAIKPFPWLEIGGGMAFLAATRAYLGITGEVDVANPVASRLRHEVDADLTSIRYPLVGVKITPRKDLRFGAVYRGEFQLSIDIDAMIDVTANPLGISVPLYAYLTTKSVNAFLPRQVALGGAWDVTERLTVVADVTWVNWAAYRSPVTIVTTTIDVKAPPWVPSSMLPEKPAPTVYLPPNFENRVVPRVGVEGRIPVSSMGSELALRAGYFYERTPIPPQTSALNFVDSDRHGFTAGVGLKLHHPIAEIPGDVGLDVHAMFSLLPERVTTKASPADTTGDYRSSGTIWSLGTTLTVVFR